MKVKKLQLTDRQYWPQYICTVFQKTKTISFSRNSVKNGSISIIFGTQILRALLALCYSYGSIVHVKCYEMK